MSNKKTISNDAASEVYERVLYFMSELDVMKGRTHAVKLAALINNCGCRPTTTNYVNEANVKKLRDQLTALCFDNDLIITRTWWNIYLNVVTLTLLHYNTDSVQEREDITQYFGLIYTILDIKFKPGTEIFNHHINIPEREYGTTVIKSKNHHG
jgi:hypothetical protein